MLTKANCILSNLYTVVFDVNVNENFNNKNNAFAVSENEDQFVISHKRLAHLNFKDLTFLKNSGLLPIKGNLKENFCESCILGKQSRTPFKTNNVKTTYPLELVHTDVCMVTTSSYNQRKYFVTFLDDFTHFCYVYLICKKSEVFSKFKEYHDLATNRFNRNILRLRCDRGTEYLSEPFKNFCLNNSIHLEPSAYSPQ